MNNNKTVAFLTLGCKVNSYETEAIKQMFIDEGYNVVNFNEKADIYIVNTCTVTNIADRKSRQMLHRAKKISENSIVVAVGCYVQAAKDILDKDDKIDIVIGNNKKKDIVNIINEYNMDKKRKNVILDIDNEHEYESLAIDNMSEKTRAYIKIQDGCNQFCSYCIIPYARGRSRSREAADIYSEIERLVEKGYKEVVLTGIHLSSYGLDLDSKISYNKELNPGKHLLELIDGISKYKEIKRIRLGSLEPRIITEEFVKRLVENEKVCPHFHLSLQSGCDQTLTRMNRQYTSREYLSKCELIRKHFINPSITTDIIVGFPGETDEEFDQTYEFIKKINFYETHIFQYSKRENTKAATMENQISKNTMNVRSKKLMELNTIQRDNFLLNFTESNIQEILLEESIIIDGKEYWIGHNERYIKFAVKSENLNCNKIVLVKNIKKLTDEILVGEIVNND